MLLTKFGRPSIHLSICCALWSVISLCTAFCKNFGQLLTIRLLTGVVEAAFVPGCLFTITKWYTKKELCLRMAVLFAGPKISLILAGFFGAAILRMDGLQNLAGWQVGFQCLLQWLLLGADSCHQLRTTVDFHHRRLHDPGSLCADPLRPA